MYENEFKVNENKLKMYIYELIMNDNESTMNLK